MARPGRKPTPGRQLMALPACCLYLLLMLLVGYAVISLVHPAYRMTVFQLTGLAAAVGAGTLGLLLFWASLIGFAPSRLLLAVIGGLALAGLFVLEKRNGSRRPHSGRPTGRKAKGGSLYRWL